MKRFVIFAAMCVTVAGLAATLDDKDVRQVDTYLIRVTPDEVEECEATLRELRQRPVVTDSGWALPSFMVDDDLPRSVCVAGT